MNARPRGGGNSGRGGGASRGGRGRGRGRPSRRGGGTSSSSGVPGNGGPAVRASDHGAQGAGIKPRGKPSRSRAPRLAVKLAVRRLPPALPSAEFYKVVDSLGALAARSRAYVPGDVRSVLVNAFDGKSASSTGNAKACTPSVNAVSNIGFGSSGGFTDDFSVAFLGFANIDDAEKFFISMEEAKVTFTDPKTGLAYVPRIERALNQAIARPERRSCLAAVGTIESDPDFVKFREEYEKEIEAERNTIAPPSLSDTDALFSGVPEAANYLGDSLRTLDFSRGGKAIPGSAKRIGAMSSILGLEFGNSSGASRTAKGATGIGSVAIIDGANVHDPGVVVTPLIEEIRAKRREREQQSAARRTGVGSNVISKSARRAKKVANAASNQPGMKSAAPALGGNAVNSTSDQVSPVSIHNHSAQFSRQAKTPTRNAVGSSKRPGDSRSRSSPGMSKGSGAPGGSSSSSRVFLPGGQSPAVSTSTPRQNSDNEATAHGSSLSTPVSALREPVLESNNKGPASYMTPKRPGGRSASRRGGRGRGGKAGGGRGRGQVNDAKAEDHVPVGVGCSENSTVALRTPLPHAGQGQDSIFTSLNANMPSLPPSVRLLRKVPRLEESSGG